MKHCRWFVILFIALSTNAYSFQPKVEIIEQFDNLKMVAFISKEDIKSNPEWVPGSDALPLTVIDAIQAVKDFDKTLTKSNTIVEIEIRLIPKHEKEWHYLIKITNDTVKSKYNIYVVLMNGKVIPAIIEPQSYK